MKIMPSRRGWRAAFRRLRIYVPFALFALVGLAVLLPISAPWASRLAEEQLEARFGVAVSFERMTVSLAQGEAVARGLVVVAPDVDEPFRIELVRLSGSPSGLLAGDGSWPERVEIISPSPIRIAADERGVVGVQGAARALVVAAQGPRGSAPAPPAAGTTERGLPKRVPPTPEVVLSNVLVELPRLGGDGALGLRIDRLEIARRLSANSPVMLVSYGEAVAGGIDRWRFESSWVPGQDSLGVALKLDAARTALGLEGAPRALANMRDVDLKASLRGLDDMATPILVDAQLSVGLLEIAEARVGGARWDERDLKMDLSGEVDFATKAASVRQLTLTGADLDASLSADYRAEDGGILSARAAARRIPGDVLELGRDFLDREYGVLVEPAATTATLSLDAELRDFRPARPDFRPGIVARVTGGGWSVEPRGWPSPVLVDRVDIGANSIGELDIDALAVRLGDLRARASGRLPLTRLAEGDTSATLRITASGVPESAVQLAQELGLLSPELVLAEIPLALDVTLDVGPGAGAGPSVTAWPQRGSLVWGQGAVRLLGLRDPVLVSPGAVELDPGGLAIRQFAAGFGSLGVRGAGRIDGDFRKALADRDTPLTATLSLDVDGDISDALERIARQVTLPVPSNAVSGAFAVGAEVIVPLHDPAAATGDARVRLSGVSASFAIPTGTATLDGVALEASLSRERIDITRLAGGLVDPRGNRSAFDLRASVAEDAIRTEGSIDTDFGILEVMAPEQIGDLYAEGKLPARIRAALVANEPIEPGTDIASRWIATLERRARTIRLEEDAPLFADVRVDYLWEEPVRFFARDMPIMIENIRGNARFTSAEGVVFENVLADAGSTRNLRANGRVTFGSMVLFKFRAEADYLPITPWLSGWGEQPWARSRYEDAAGRRRAATTGPRLMTVIEGEITAREGEFYNTFGQDLSTSLRYEIWRGRPMLLELRDLRARAYGGRAEAEVRFELSPGRAHMDLRGRLEESDVQQLLTDFLQRAEDTTGRVTGELELKGVLQDQTTYQGSAWLQLNDSSLLGGKVLRTLTTALRPFNAKQAADTTISAQLAIRDREIVVSDGVIRNPALSLTTDGVITFDARIWFRVTATFLDQLPLVGPLITVIGSNVINPMVVGTIQSPKAIVRPLGVMEENRPAGLPMPNSRKQGDTP